MIRFARKTCEAVALVTVATLGVAGCGAGATERSASTPALNVPATHSFNPFPPPVNEMTLVPGPASNLHPGVPIMVGDGDGALWCTAGFYIDYPDPNRRGQRLPAFITAGQCAQGDSQAPVAVMQAAGADDTTPETAKIGAITYLTPGDERPAVAGKPWTIPVSPLAVFTSGRADWSVPVDATVNGKPTPNATVQAAAADQREALAMWTDSRGLVVTGHVLNPATTPELKDIPAGIERVVVAADDATKPIDQWERGSAVTVDLDGVTYNLGIITDTDAVRHWIVVDLIGPFLAKHDAHIVTTG